MTDSDDALEEADDTGVIPFIHQTQNNNNNNNIVDSDDQLEEADDTGVIPFIPASDTGQSRLQNEFEILKWLGKGGFGDVIKVSVLVAQLW